MALRKQVQIFYASQTCLEALISYCACRPSTALRAYQAQFMHGSAKHVRRQPHSLMFTVDLLWLAQVFAVHTKLGTVTKALARLKRALPKLDSVLYFSTRPHWIFHGYSPQQNTIDLSYEGEGEDAPPKHDTNNATWFANTYHIKKQQRRAVTLRCKNGSNITMYVQS